MQHLLEVYALALDAPAFGNSDRHSDNLEAENAAPSRHLTPQGNNASTAASTSKMTISAPQHLTGPQSDLNLGITVLVDSATSTVFDHTDTQRRFD
jgi:hypothetical protein